MRSEMWTIAKAMGKFLSKTKQINNGEMAALQEGQDQQKKL